ncbi:MAG: sigma-54 dependent transcriptional regulator [Candidatus Coatesbacteria bacterium]
MTPALGRILVADDEESIRVYLRDLLRDEGYAVLTAAGGHEAVEIAEREQVHLALVDLVMKDLSGLEVLKRLLEKSAGTRVMIMTAHASVETAVEAMKAGALDYLIKPFTMDEVRLRVRRAMGEVALTHENLVLRQEAARQSRAGDLVGRSPAFLAAVAVADKVAEGRTTVLVLGETGTGKELIARRLHRKSLRRSGPFLAINCAAVPENLLESELFGHERGAFTGAGEARPGLLEAAADGTLLLDEISDMPHALQAKLLRVLEGHEYLRVGGTRPRTSHVRFLASTNRDPAVAVAEKRFREDLYFRLNVVSVNLPPLRERGDDVVLLAEHFARGFTAERGKRIDGYSPQALGRLREYAWPGNVRELRNVVERAVILGEGTRLEVSDLRLDSGPMGGGDAASFMSLPYRDAKDAFEKTYLERALKESGGNVSRAAARIKLFRQNLQVKLRKHGLGGKG